VIQVRTLDLIKSALLSSRDQYPGNSNMLSAALGEFSELAAELTKANNDSRIHLEAADVIAILIRIMEEGDSSWGANPACYLHSSCLPPEPSEGDPFDDSEEA
jgi:hypothetical protein